MIGIATAEESQMEFTLQVAIQRIAKAIAWHHGDFRIIENSCINGLNI